LPSMGMALLTPLVLGPGRRWPALSDRNLLALADALRQDASLLASLCPDVGVPKSGGLRELQQALDLARPLSEDLPELNRALRRSHSLEAAAAKARDPLAALAYLKAADRVIRVDDFAA